MRVQANTNKQSAIDTRNKTHRAGKTKTARARALGGNSPAVQATNLATDEDWLRYRAAARVLGMAKPTLENNISSGRLDIPFYKVGGKVLFKRSQLLAWLEERKHGASVNAA
jgi:excisionase family DNA binding protein